MNHTEKSKEYFAQRFNCAQADPNVPVVFTDNAQNGEKLLGDADKDGQLNIKDATAIQKNIAGLLEFDSEQTSLADFNADSEVNIKDATAIQKKIAGIETGNSIGELVEQPR